MSVFEKILRFVVFSKHTLKSSCAMRFICLKNIHMGAFFRNVHTPINLSSYKIRKISSLVDFYSLYQLLYSRVYRNSLKLRISSVKICMINEGESNRKLPKMFAGQNIRMTQKSFTGGFNQKRLDAVC